MTDQASPAPATSINWNGWIRVAHRWISVAFTLGVIATFIALAQKEPMIWVSYVPLFPLALLFITGAYMFARPYFSKWRGRAL